MRTHVRNTHAHTHTHTTHMHTHTRTCTCTHTHNTRTCTQHTHAHAHNTHTHMHTTHMHTHTHTTQTRTHTRTHTTNMHIHTYTHTIHMHTHIRAHARACNAAGAGLNHETEHSSPLGAAGHRVRKHGARKHRGCSGWWASSVQELGARRAQAQRLFWVVGKQRARVGSMARASTETVLGGGKPHKRARGPAAAQHTHALPEGMHTQV